MKPRSVNITCRLLGTTTLSMLTQRSITKFMLGTTTTTSALSMLTQSSRSQIKDPNRSLALN